MTKTADFDEDEIPEGAARLFQIETREVSLVDRPANQQPFLVVKSADGSGQNPDPTSPSIAPLEKAGQAKTESGKQFPASCYAYVPDASQPSTWKLRLCESPDGKPSVKLTAYAAAALGPKGWRGNKVQIPSGDLASVKSKVRAAYLAARKAAGQEVSSEDLPAQIKKSLGVVISDAFAEAEGLATVVDLIEVTSNLSKTFEQINAALAGATEAGVTTSTQAPEVQKAGRPLNGERLGRLKGILKNLRDALGETRTGVVPLEKFDAVASGISRLIDECDVSKFLAAKAVEAKKSIGAFDAATRGATPLAPNVGAGYQPDLSTVAGADAVFGDSVPSLPVDVAGIMKRLDAVERRSKGLEVEVEKKNKKIHGLLDEVASLKKFREAPSAYDEGAALESLGGSAEDYSGGDVSWEADMAASPLGG